MVTPSPTIMFSLIPFDIKPSRRAPQALNRIIEHIGADVESQTKANFSLLTPFLSQSGLATVPAIRLL